MPDGLARRWPSAGRPLIHKRVIRQWLTCGFVLCHLILDRRPVRQPVLASRLGGGLVAP
jgi:hypothetical protein